MIKRHFSVHKTSRNNIIWDLKSDIKLYEAAELYCKASAIESRDTEDTFFILLHESNSLLRNVECITIVQAVTGTLLRSPRQVNNILMASEV
jgi:hypothetical protein